MVFNPAHCSTMLTSQPYAALGLQPVVNANGHETSLGGSLMPPEVVDAMRAASRHYVPLRALQRATGRRVAEIIGAPAALITSGASGGILLATAACLSGRDREVALRLPHLPPGSRNEVLVWRMARPNYLYPPCEMAGGRLVEVGAPDAVLSPDDFRAALTSRTAAILLMIHALDEARDRTGGWEALVGGVCHFAREAGVPVLVDAAAELPPRALARGLFDLGASAVLLSGGKAIRGPQSSGILAATPELVEAALLHNVPDRMLARPLKVGKEELVGLTAAVERFWAMDEAAQLTEWRDWCQEIVRAAHGAGGAAARVVEGIPGYGRPPVVPKAVITLPGGPAAAAAAVQALQAGDPPIVCGRRGDALVVNPMALEDGEASLVGTRLAAVLQGVC